MLQKQQTVSEENQQDFIKEVREYIEQAKRSGSNISSTRERDQIRANLRYWANYVYGIEKNFPDTELAPSMIETKRPSSGLIIVISFLIIFSLVGIQIFRSIINGLAELPTNTPIPAETQAAVTPSIETPGLALPTESPTPEPTGFNVTLSSPANGESIAPANGSGGKITIDFEGTFSNLDPRWTIHVFFIRGDKVFPIKESFPVADQPAGNSWTIQTELTESIDEMSNAQSYPVVLALSLDPATDELLAKSTTDGLDIKNLPSTVIIIQESSRVLFRQAFKIIREPRLVYSYFDGTSYDLYSSQLDGSDVIQLTSTQEHSEMFPNLSPDGTKIVYVKRTRDTDRDPFTYTIAIMDSNGQNNYELTDETQNVLESPLWSPDSSYISYAVIERRESSSTPYSSIHTYHLASKEDKSISGDPEAFVNRFSTWIPDKNIIVFEAGIGDITRFVQVTVDSQEFSVYFDPKQFVVQPNISSLENGHLLMYTVIGPAPNYVHDIYAAINPNGENPFDGIPVLIIKSGGEVVDYPQVDPNSNTLYYTRNGAIFRIEFQLESGRIRPIRNANVSENGEQVIPANPTREAIYFDINFMDTFFSVP
jgi:hypothetical protein